MSWLRLFSLTTIVSSGAIIGIVLAAFLSFWLHPPVGPALHTSQTDRWTPAILLTAAVSGGIVAALLAEWLRRKSQN